MFLKATLNTPFEKKITYFSIYKGSQMQYNKTKPGTLILKTLPVHYYSKKRGGMSRIADFLLTTKSFTFFTAKSLGMFTLPAKTGCQF